MSEFSSSSSFSNLPSAHGVQFFGTFSHPLAVKLDENNFLQWRQQVLAACKGHGLPQFIFKKDLAPPEFLKDSDREFGKINDAYLVWQQ